MLAGTAPAQNVPPLTGVMASGATSILQPGDCFVGCGLLMTYAVPCHSEYGRVQGTPSEVGRLAGVVSELRGDAAGLRTAVARCRTAPACHSERQSPPKPIGRQPQ